MLCGKADISGETPAADSAVRAPHVPQTADLKAYLAASLWLEMGSDLALSFAQLEYVYLWNNY